MQHVIQIEDKHGTGYFGAFLGSMVSRDFSLDTAKKFTTYEQARQTAEQLCDAFDMLGHDAGVFVVGGAA